MGLRDVFRSLTGGGSKDQGGRSPLFAAGRPDGRTSGRPPSGNGASSFHLEWDLAPRPLREVAVSIEVVTPPTVAELYFWALQVNFVRSPERGGLPVGGAHIGLQHHPGYPDSGAVNWGGYANRGGELEGSVSALPSALNNVNTRTFPWQAHRRYRYRIQKFPERLSPGDAQGWRGSITDTATGVETVIRDLFVDADAMVSPVMWSEVFAQCDDPSAVVRWSDPVAVAMDGTVLRPRQVRLNYQRHEDGGCANTNSWVDTMGDGSTTVSQATAAERTNPTGTQLSL